MEFFKKMLKGFLVGLGAIVPGVSGGVLATVLGIYEPIMEALANFFKNIKKNIEFLLPYVIGGGIGFIVFALILRVLLDVAKAELFALFIGLIIGSFPSLIAEANDTEGGFRGRYLIFAFLSFTVMTCLAPLLNATIPNEFVRYFAGGAVYSIGSIVPGISSSLILEGMGIFESAIKGVTALDMSVIIPVGLGFAITSVLLIKGVNYVFKRFHGYAYYTVMGFLTSGIVYEIYNQIWVDKAIASPVDGVILASILLAGMLGGFFFVKFSNK